MHRFPSAEWTQALKIALNTDREYREVGKPWTFGPVAMIVRADSSYGLERDAGIVLDVHQGECRGARFVEGEGVRLMLEVGTDLRHVVRQLDAVVPEEDGSVDRTTARQSERGARLGRLLRVRARGVQGAGVGARRERLGPHGAHLHAA